MPDVVIALVCNEEGEYLSLRRAKGKDDGVVWSFPSGKVEAGESESAAVVREVLEETGVLCRPERKIGQRNMGESLRLHFWKCAVVGGHPRDPESGETSEVAFRSRARLQALIPVESMSVPVRAELGLGV